MVQVSISIDVPDLAEGEAQPCHRYHVISTCSRSLVISTEESEANETERSDTRDNLSLNNHPQSR